MMKRVVVFLFLSSLVFSCGSKKSVANKNHSKSTKNERIVIAATPNNTSIINGSNTSAIKPVKFTSTEQYLISFSDVAKEEMRLYGIPASITLAQGLLESNSGKSRLSVEANNHFGIKCHDWTGAKVYHDDDEAHECFRKYKDAKYSYRDHSLFLSTRKRYSKLFDLQKDDYKRWAKELKAAGYATDRKYPDKLITLIERYELYKFDDEVLNRKKRKRDKESEIVNNSSHVVEVVDVEPIISKPDSSHIVKEPQPVEIVDNNFCIVGEGDTLYSISKKYNLTVKELQDMNDLMDTDISLGQKLQVRTGGEGVTYIVQTGDTLYSISKKHNTTVQKLQELNGLNDTTISIGQELTVK